MSDVDKMNAFDNLKAEYEALEQQLAKWKEKYELANGRYGEYVAKFMDEQNKVVELRKKLASSQANYKTMSENALLLEGRLAASQQRVKELEDRIEHINKTNTPYAHYALELEIELKKAFAERDSLKREVERLKSNWESETNKHTFSRFLELEERCDKLEEALTQIANGSFTAVSVVPQMRRLAEAALNSNKHKHDKTTKINWEHGAWGCSCGETWIEQT